MITDAAGTVCRGLNPSMKPPACTCSRPFLSALYPLVPSEHDRQCRASTQTPRCRGLRAPASLQWELWVPGPRPSASLPEVVSKEALRD